MAALVSLATVTAFADTSSVDAGDTKETATLLPGWGSHGGYLSPRDWDWYKVEEPSPAPRCIEATYWGENNDTARITVESPDRTREASVRVPAGATRTLALAVPALSRAYFDVTASPNDPNRGDPARPGAYTFTLSRTGVPAPGAGDALTGSDAGNDIGRATPVTGSCIGGRLSPLMGMGDLRDVYAVQVGHSQSLTYGFGATGAPGDATLSLLAVNGSSVGPTLVSGERASVALPEGTYYLSAARANVGIEDIGYVISWIPGPPDPNGCRPYC